MVKLTLLGLFAVICVASAQEMIEQMIVNAMAPRPYSWGINHPKYIIRRLTRAEEFCKVQEKDSAPMPAECNNNFVNLRIEQFNALKLKGVAKAERSFCGPPCITRRFNKGEDPAHSMAKRIRFYAECGVYCERANATKAMLNDRDMKNKCGARCQRRRVKFNAPLDACDTTRHNLDEKKLELFNDYHQEWQAKYQIKIKTMVEKEIERLTPIDEDKAREYCPFIQEVSDLSFDVCGPPAVPRTCEAKANRDNACAALNPTHMFFQDCVYEDANAKDWIVIQRKENNDVAFDRNWEDYKKGFGDTFNFWYGLDAIHTLCNEWTPCELKIEMTYVSDGTTYNINAPFVDHNKSKYYALYHRFALGNEADKYRLHVKGYSGDGGDSIGHENGLNKVGFSYVMLDGMQFTTKDNDNDLAHGWSCAYGTEPGWWYNECAAGNPNALKWLTLGNLQSVEMKVRPCVGA